MKRMTVKVPPCFIPQRILYYRCDLHMILLETICIHEGNIVWAQDLELDRPRVEFIRFGPAVALPHGEHRRLRAADARA